MKVSDVDKIHIRVHGNFRGCLCHPIKDLYVWIKAAGTQFPHEDALTYGYWNGEKLEKKLIKRTAKINEATCEMCLVLWDVWLGSFSRNPPRPHRDQIQDLIDELPEQYK